MPVTVCDAVRCLYQAVQGDVQGDIYNIMSLQRMQASVVNKYACKHMLCMQHVLRQWLPQLTVWG